MRITINTGRQYTALGQLVTFEQEDGGPIRFTDHSRYICGTVDAERTYTDGESMARRAMRAYDGGHYRAASHGPKADETVILMRL